MDEKKTYTMQEVADELGKTRQTIYRWIKSGKLKAIKIGGTWTVSAELLDRIKREGTD